MRLSQTQDTAERPRNRIPQNQIISTLKPRPRDGSARGSVVYDNFDGYAQLARELRTPLQIGENFYGPRDLHKALRAGACDYAMPDFMRIGGITGWMRAAAIAGAAGIPMSTHLYPEVGAHAMRATETAHWLEWQDWADPILQEPYEIRDSHLHIPDVPGVGLEWNEDVVARNLYEA